METIKKSTGRITEKLNSVYSSDDTLPIQEELEIIKGKLGLRKYKTIMVALENILDGTEIRKTTLNIEYKTDINENKYKTSDDPLDRIKFVIDFINDLKNIKEIKIRGLVDELAGLNSDKEIIIKNEILDVIKKNLGLYLIENEEKVKSFISRHLYNLV